MRGTYDWGEYAAKAGLEGYISPSELAVRLGSISRFNRKGDVIFFSGFEEGLSLFAQEYTDSTPIPKVSIAYPGSGSYSLYLNLPALANKYYVISRLLPFFLTEFIGCEQHFTLSWDSCIQLIRFDYLYNLKRYTAMIMFTNPDGSVQLLDSGGNWQDILSLNATEFWADMYYFTKLVINSKLNKYEKLYVNNHIIDLSSYDLYNADETAEDVFYYEFQFANLLSSVAECYLDDIIITVNE